jgi:hypothetical protein
MLWRPNLIDVERHESMRASEMSPAVWNSNAPGSAFEPPESTRLIAQFALKRRLKMVIREAAHCTVSPRQWHIERILNSSREN